MHIVNIAAYKFVDLDGLPELRVQIRELCESLELRGTVLLSEEGVNLFLAGTVAAIAEFKTRLLEDARFTGIEFKDSLSDHLPFNRLLVKIKKEIISMGVPEIRPAHHSAPYISAQEFKRWLDEGRDIIVLDTRNEFEVKLGSFKAAQHLNVHTFRDFPAAVQKLDPSLKKKTVVTFCTGGIRCEKAAPLMQEFGFEDVYQLDGGILKYFEECGAEHYEGECFVFDRRVALDAKLQETKTAQCFVCLSPLSLEEQQLPQYVFGVSCPHCINQKPVKRIAA